MARPVCHALDGDCYSPEQVELLKAMDKYKQENNRRFPAYTEVLAVLISLGWRKAEKAGPLPVYHETFNRFGIGGKKRKKSP